MMKYISHYFPFFTLTLVIYGFIFHFHQQSTVIPKLPINSGQQSVQVQFIEIAETAPTELTKPKVLKPTKPAETSTLKKEPVEDTPAIEKTTKKQVLKKNKSTEKTIQQKVPPKIEQPIPEVQTQNNSVVNVAKQQLNKTIKETSVDSIATLKAALLEAEFNLPSSNLGQSAKLTKPKKAQKTAPSLTIKDKPSPSTKAAKPTPATAKKDNQKRTKNKVSKDTEKTIVEQKTEPKTVVKKQPTKSNNVQNKGVLQEAIVVSGHTPIYPRRAILRNQQGRVVVKLTVDMQGKIQNPQIVTSSGFSILDNTILDFVKRERFMPAHKGAEKITSEQIFSFRFELK